MYEKEVQPVGENLPDKVHVYQYKVVSSFLPGGALLAKIDSFRVLLEESAYSLSGSQHLGDLIPCILDEEKRKIILDEEKREINVIAAKHVSVIFDETRHICEAMVVVLHYNQRVVRLMLLEKSLITTLSTDLGI